jgi:hypothetical protein
MAAGAASDVQWKLLAGIVSVRTAYASIVDIRLTERPDESAMHRLRSMLLTYFKCRLQAFLGAPPEFA